jgi:integrase
VGRSKEIALLALKDAEVKAARDEFGFSQKDITIEKFIDQFLEFNKANNSRATYVRYRSSLDNFKEFLKHHPKITFLSQINAKLIDQYKIYRKNELVNPNGKPVMDGDRVSPLTQKGVKAHTINTDLKVLSTMFNLAVKWEYLKENPARKVTRLKVNDAKPPRFLSKDEIKRLLDNSPEHLFPIFFTFLNTGMRKGELENLEWSDIDLRRKKIRIRRKEFWKPKTDERDIPINPPLLRLLSDLKRNNDKGLKSNFVFPHKDGGRIKTKLREELIKVARKADIEDLTKLHSLRHTFASHLVMGGVDLPTVKKLMGHSDIQTTMVYAHLAPDHLSEAVDKLGF